MRAPDRTLGALCLDPRLGSLGEWRGRDEGPECLPPARMGDAESATNLGAIEVAQARLLSHLSDRDPLQAGKYLAAEEVGVGRFATGLRPRLSLYPPAPDPPDGAFQANRYG